MTDCTQLMTDFHLCPEGWRLYFLIDDDHPETLDAYRRHRDSCDECTKRKDEE